MRPFLALLLAAFTALAIASSAQAVPCEVPRLPPPPPCPVWPAPEPGTGLVGEVGSILHTVTQANCDIAGGVYDIATMTYGFALNLLAITTNEVFHPVDETQDATCEFVYGDPNAPEAACQRLIPECPTKVPPY